ncbi:MAG: FAD-dependent oxidoreductase [Bacteroidetes bacterium]|nr:FAD-dependent oxidoreductase [Bacteroidota bacterium]
MIEKNNINNFSSGSNDRHVVIIGNGISGVTCACNLRKYGDFKITIISSESDHFFSRTALMYIYMGHMKFEHTKPYEDRFWVNNNIHLIKNTVVKVNINEKSLQFKDDALFNYDALVIATGSRSNQFGWPGQDLKGVQGLYHLSDLEMMEKNTKNISRAVIVGGGLIGIEMAEMLRSRNIDVTFLVREKNFWDSVLPVEEATMIARHIREHKIELKAETELKEVKGDVNGRVSSVITNKGEEIKCEFVALTVGVSANIDFLKDSGIETDKGVLVNEFFETNVEDIYAIGDCAQHKNPPESRRPVEQVWYTGKIQGETLAQVLCGKKIPYAPGYWFNSAKFFDIEYQTYGVVNAQPKENEKVFYWEHSSGKISLRLVYNSADGKLLGTNVFGIRLRHEVFDRWLNEKREVDYIIEHLATANFDPEFYRRHEHQIIEEYNRQTGKCIKTKTRKGFFASFFK